MTTDNGIHDGHVLVVARSRVNLIVVSEIVHRYGLRTQQCSDIESAQIHLASQRPVLIILDGGTHNRDCDALMEDIAALRRTDDAGRPRVIMLSNRNSSATSLPPSSPVDEVVAKPIIPERLQAVFRRLLRQIA